MRSLYLRRSLLRAQVVESLWTALLAGRTELTDGLWCLLIVQGWLESQKTFSPRTDHQKAS